MRRANFAARLFVMQNSKTDIDIDYPLCVCLLAGDSCFGFNCSMARDEFCEAKVSQVMELLLLPLWLPSPPRDSIERRDSPAKGAAGANVTTQR